MIEGLADGAVRAGQGMKLIGTYRSPFARRVAAALVSRGIAFEHHDVNGYRQFETAQLYNPLGKVPSLVLDDGEILIDSTAILDHLNELTPAAPLIPNASKSRRRALRLAAVGYGVCEVAISLALRGEDAAPAVAERWRAQLLGGLQALDRAASEDDAFGEHPLDVAAITAIVAVELVARTASAPALEAVPALASMAARHADAAPFARTRPEP